MINLELKKYALALFKVAQEQNKLNILNENIESFKDILQKVNPSLVETLRAPVIDKEKLIDIFNIALNAMNADKIFANFIRLLVINNYTNVLTDFLNNWDNLYKIFSGYERIELITAEPLLPEQEQTIKEHLSKKYGEKFFIEKIVDKNIIAGLIVRAKDFEFNDSLLGKLNNLKQNIKKGAV